MFAQRKKKKDQVLIREFVFIAVEPQPETLRLYELFASISERI